MRHTSHLFPGIKHALNGGQFANGMHSLRNALLSFFRDTQKVPKEEKNLHQLLHDVRPWGRFLQEPGQRWAPPCMASYSGNASPYACTYPIIRVPLYIMITHQPTHLYP